MQWSRFEQPCSRKETIENGARREVKRCVEQRCSIGSSDHRLLVCSVESFQIAHLQIR
jgi:hypothetical protein